MITRKSLADEVAESLQQQIAAGKFKVNEQLPIEPELMKTFGVGRSSIREAIKLLVNSGYLRVQQGVGTFVADASGVKEPLSQRLKRSSKEDISEVRQLLELKIVEKAALKRTEADIKKMTRHLHKRLQMAEAGLLAESVEADIQFHIAVAEACKNDILADLYKSFTSHMQQQFLSYKDAEIFITTNPIHEHLLQCIIDKDPKKAVHWASKL
ncbi:DNA-binding transcriptional regulator, FadR family [Filimonas lacunae]|uniref:DNA-binding transcriptional regulator, FadR family n=1 Tax=Filimonas lacunae TaxID=477680 RepID=A0A173MJF3_9BACT|nr:FadR/GntR family transcriptional regulator [Filimonas lacunae]BAV07772.1 transcriptional regulator, GntR family [Filimonas lacunae]SIT04577.1 DNA-binding transcriptional regulator, FadR family [Filimonas lacunae]